MRKTISTASIQTILNDWPSWTFCTAKPLIKQPLSQGKNNQSFLISSCDEKYQWVLRINNTQTPRIDEKSILTLLDKTNIAPKILYSTKQYTIFNYIDGETLDKQLEKLASDLFLAPLITTINSYQNIEHTIKNFSYTQILHDYWQQLEEKNLRTDALRTTYKTALSCLLELEKKNLPLKLCHHDLNPLNILIREKAHYTLLDWEFSGAGYAVIDFASLAIECEVDDNRIIDLACLDASSYQLGKQIYIGLCELWQANTTCH